MGKSSEQDTEILFRRAEDLARPITNVERAEDRIALLEFLLMGARYAIRLDRVEAVTRIGEIFSVPLTPRHISGVIRRRGQSFALVSLRHFFHSNAEGIADADFAVYVRSKGKQFAIQVEEIEGVIHLPRAKLLPAPETFDYAQAPYIAGVTLEGLALIDVDAMVEADGFSAGRKH
ncbi:MAG: CheW domain-containing protein [Myxococcota bacterium]|nr:CheW domain-containing protein [Myxococcota bacterium]